MWRTSDDDSEDWGDSFDDRDSEFWNDLYSGPDDDEIEEFANLEKIIDVEYHEGLIEREENEDPNNEWLASLEWIKENPEFIDLIDRHSIEKIVNKSSMMNTNRFWVGSPANSKMLWVLDKQMPHEDPNMVYLFGIHSNKMEEYEKGFARARLKPVIDEKRNQAVESYLVWYQKNGEKFLQVDCERVRRELAKRSEIYNEIDAAEIELHEKYIDSLDVLYPVTQNVEVNNQRATHCYLCKNNLDTNINIQCASCGWLICTCGACGCGYGH